MTDLTRVSSSLYGEGLIPDLFGSLGGQQIDRVVDDTTSQVSLLRGSSNGDDYVRYQIVNEFRVRGVTNYCDFYFLPLIEFRNIVNMIAGGPELFKKLTGKNISEIKVEDKENFGKSIGFERMSLDAFKMYITRLLSHEGVSSIDELRVFGLRRFKEKFGDDNVVRYFFIKMIRKDIENSNLEDLLKIGDHLGLSVLSDDELKDKMRPLFLNVDRGIAVNDFWNAYSGNLSVGVYFSKIGKFNYSTGLIYTNLYRTEIEGMFDYLGFEDELGTQREKEYVMTFLKHHGIFTYSDFKLLGSREIGNMICQDRVCRGILKRFGLLEVKNFNTEYLKRLSRYVGLEGVPKNVEYDLESTKLLLIELLTKQEVRCLYGLRFMGLERFKIAIRSSPRDIYKQIDFYIKKITGKTVTCINTDDLEILGKSLGYSELTEDEHKSMLLGFMQTKGISISSININSLRKTPKLRYNPHFRYFLETLFGIKNVNNFTSSQASDFISYLSN